MRQGFAALAALLAAVSVSSGARAACAAPSFPIAITDPRFKPYVERYDALVAGDPYLTTGSMAAGWRALVDAVQRQPDAPPELVARSRMMLAGALQMDSDTAEALAVARAAEQFAQERKLTDRPFHAELLSTLAVKEANAGKAVDAVAHADAGLAATARWFGEQSWAYGNAAMAVTIAHNAFGDYVGAEHYAALAERLAPLCLPPDTMLIGQTMTGHAATLGTLGQTEEALAEVERAAAWAFAHVPESDELIPYTLADFGWSLRNAGRLREAEALLRRATDLYARYNPERWNSRGLAAGKFANILAAEGKYREAEAMWLASRDYYARSHDLSNPLSGSGELRRAADAAQAQGELGRTLELRRQAVALIAGRVQPRHPELARSRIEYAATLALAGRARAAQAIAAPAVALIRETASPGDFKRMGAEIAYALIAAAAGAAPHETYAAAAPIAARMEKILLDTATSRGDLIRFAPTFSTSFAATAKLALAAHDEEAAFHALQLANLSDIVLVDAAIAARAAASEPKEDALIRRIGDLARDRQQLDRERSFAVSSPDADRSLKIEAAIRRNDADIAAATRDLDRIFPQFRALSRPVPVTLAAYRARLGANDILIAPLSLPGETLTVAVTRDGLSWATTPILRSRVTALVARIRGSIDAARRRASARFDSAAARDLGAIVLPRALAPALRAHRHLRYYASGALATVPPALLITGSAEAGGGPAWLIRSHSVSIVSTLAPPPHASRRPQDSFLGIGAPTLGAGPLTLATRGAALDLGEFGSPSLAALPPLPYAARELRAMATMFPATRRSVLVGSAATETAVKALPLDRFGVILIATHGLLPDALPGLTQPALVLTPPRTASLLDDGLLTAGEVARLHLDADWVILSACETAGASDPQGASYSGLSSAFIQAGARALLVSHWPVRDDAAQHLTVATLAGTRRGLDRATALQRAMLALMRDRSVPGAANPAIWAPFVLVE